LELRDASLSYALIVYQAFIRNMPRPRRDGTPARPLPNRRRLTDAFIRTVQPDPNRVVVYWDTLQRGLALRVQPSGHLAWKCVYTIHGRGPRWYSIGDARAITLPDARKLAAKLMYQVIEGKDPHADRLALRGRGSFEQVARRYVEEHARRRNKSWRQGDALVAKYLLPRWAKLDIGSIRRADVKAAVAVIAAPVLANQVLAAASPIFSWAMRQEIIAANPCLGVEKNNTTSRERVLSDAEIAAFWRQLSAPLKMILLTGQRPGEVAHLHRAHVVDDRWWVMPGAPDPAASWPGTKNAQSHRVWLSEPVHALLPDVLAAAMRSTGRMQRDMRNLCYLLGTVEKVTPHDLRRTFCSKVTALGFGRDAMNRVTNHKEGGIADVYDRHRYQEENKEIMETVARHIVALSEGATNAVALGRGR
jgi:integrase